MTKLINCICDDFSASAKNKTYLRLLGITHVLNTAEGTRLGQVDTGHIYYRDMPKVRYMGFPMIDQPSTDISRYFYIAAKFIENGINSGGMILRFNLFECKLQNS